jgi:UPF0271 protein
MRVDLNCDLGEGFGPWRMGDDAAMMQIVTTANIACGFHAGDPETMRRTVEHARAAGVAIGAHPGYPDLAGFGRRTWPGVTQRDIENFVAYQVGAMAAMAELAGHRLTHVKTHGALGNACADDDGLAMAVARGIRAVDSGLAFMVMPGTATQRAADRAGLRPILEIYADRSYGATFNLVPRGLDGAVLHDPELVLARLLQTLTDGVIESQCGRRLKTEVHSVCVHGDTNGAVALAGAIRSGLEAAGWTLASTVKAGPSADG